MLETQLCQKKCLRSKERPECLMLLCLLQLSCLHTSVSYGVGSSTYYTVASVYKWLLTGLCQPGSGAEEVTEGGGGWRGCAGKRSSSTAAGMDQEHINHSSNKTMTFVLPYVSMYDMTRSHEHENLERKPPAGIMSSLTSLLIVCPVLHFWWWRHDESSTGRNRTST